MPLTRILLTRSAEKEFESLDRSVQKRFALAIEELRHDPRRPRPGVDIRPLKGLKGMWRLRVGDYRGIYQLERDSVTFTRFAHRSKVYQPEPRGRDAADRSGGCGGQARNDSSNPIPTVLTDREERAGPCRDRFLSR